MTPKTKALRMTSEKEVAVEAKKWEERAGLFPRTPGGGKT
jgi:hypothetical protein